MGILRTLGFGLFLIILASLMPSVFFALQKTILSFLAGADNAFTAAGILASYAGHIPPTPTLSP